MKKDWELTPESFSLLLQWLDSDPEQAAVKYEKIRIRLIKIFACQGCADPERLTDETFDRVVAKINWLMTEYVGDPTLYFCGVARNVLKEDRRDRLNPRPLPPPPEQAEEELEQREFDCLDECMEKLPQENRRLVLAYYEGDGHAKIANRGKLANQLGITLRALRLRAYHTRLQLRECMELCLTQDHPA